MAIARGAGTEIIRSASFEAVNSTNQVLIRGDQHHIYTVLSIVVYCHVLNATSDSLKCLFSGYDSKGGTAQQGHTIFNQSVQVGETFVWNDKFSFNGYEPVDFTGPLDTIAEAEAIADQGNTNSFYQMLYVNSNHSSDDYDIFITYIDQNNA